MRRTIVIILAVAILGAVGLYNSRRDSAAPAVASTGVSNTTGTATTSSPASPASSTSFKDGTFTGSSQETPYGEVQIAVVVSGGKISDIDFLQMPSDQGHSQEVTSFSEPLLKQTTLQKQSSHIDFVSGATSTSYGYQASLQAALDKAVQS